MGEEKVRRREEEEEKEGEVKTERIKKILERGGIEK